MTFRLVLQSIWYYNVIINRGKIRKTYKIQRKWDEGLMTKYDSYREKVEQRHNKALVEVMKDLYIKENMGPSVGAKELGMPRQAFVHFVNEYDLKKLKFGDTKKKMMILPMRQTAR